MRFRHFDIIKIDQIVDGVRTTAAYDLNEVIDGFVNAAISRGDTSIVGMNEALEFIYENCFNQSEGDPIKQYAEHIPDESRCRARMDG